MEGKKMLVFSARSFSPQILRKKKKRLTNSRSLKVCLYVEMGHVLCGWPNWGEILFETRPKKEKEFNKREKPLEVGLHRVYGMTSEPASARAFVHVCPRMCVCACVRAQDQILLSHNFEASSLCLSSPLAKEYGLATWHPDERWQSGAAQYIGTVTHAHQATRTQRATCIRGRWREGQRWQDRTRIVWWRNTCELCFEQKMKGWLPPQQQWGVHVITCEAPSAMLHAGRHISHYCHPGEKLA